LVSAHAVLITARSRVSSSDVSSAVPESAGPASSIPERRSAVSGVRNATVSGHDDSAVSDDPPTSGILKPTTTEWRGAAAPTERLITSEP
jgi:hypothetical protein